MKRSHLKFLGLSLLIPGLALGLLPIVAAYTGLLGAVGAFDLYLGGVRMIALDHYGETSSAFVSPAVWALAAAGELVLIYMHLTRPQRQNRFVVSGR